MSNKENSALDPEYCKNFGPVLNLTFMFRIVETVVAIQLNNDIKDNGLDRSFQSAYKQCHITETVLVRVFG